jgi:Fe-S oxidoreductase
MFKEDEPGNKRINTERAEEALQTGASIIASNCPFCTTMLTDGVKNKEQEDQLQVLDVAEMVAQSLAE